MFSYTIQTLAVPGRYRLVGALNTVRIDRDVLLQMRVAFKLFISYIGATIVPFDCEILMDKNKGQTELVDPVAVILNLEGLAITNVIVWKPITWAGLLNSKIIQGQLFIKGV